MTDKLALRSVLFSWLVCGLGALFYSYEYLLRMSPSVMQHDLMGYYHLTGVQYGYLSGSFYYFMYVIMQIIVGLLMDRYGPRRLLTVACFFCALGAYLFACSDRLAIAMVGRFLIGFGSAFAFVGAAKLATIWLLPQRFALVSGIIFCLGMLGAMFGDTVLRMFVDSVGWRSAINGSAAAGVVLTVIIWLIVRDVNPYHQEHHSHHTMTIPEVLSGLSQSLKNSQIWLSGIVGGLLYLFLSAFAEFCAPAYLEQVHGMSRVDAANATSMIFLGCAIGAPLWGWFSDWLKLRRVPIVVGAAGAAIIISLLLYVHNLPAMAVYLLLLIFGFLSSVQILVFAIAREVSPIKISGTAIGLLNMLVMIGGLVFPPMIGKILDLNWVGTLFNGARIYSAHAYMLALSVLPVGILAGILLTLCIRETHCNLQITEHP